MLFIIAGALIFSRFIVLTRLPHELVAWVNAMGLEPLLAESRHPYRHIYLATLPFLAADFVLVALLVAFPALALWLPTVLKV
jgi:TRAP-type C4-dicarboxylate transport system permease large subunit